MAILEAMPISQVAPAMQGPLRDYVRLLDDIFGDNLAGLTAFGAVVGGGFDSARMTAASVAVLVHADLDPLRRLSEHGRTLARHAIAAPVIMTEPFIAGSLDSFPLELLEIQQQRCTLAGADFFAALAFGSEHIRLQCEREFKRIKLRLRQGVLAAGGREDVIADLEADIGEHLLRTLRGLLWLRGSHDVVPAAGVVGAYEAITGRSLPAVRAAVAGAQGVGWSEYKRLYDEVEFLASVADAH